MNSYISNGYKISTQSETYAYFSAWYQRFWLIILSSQIYVIGRIVLLAEHNISETTNNIKLNFIIIYTLNSACIGSLSITFHNKSGRSCLIYLYFARFGRHRLWKTLRWYFWNYIYMDIFLFHNLVTRRCKQNIGVNRTWV